ncbi:hypothetical protein PVAP13_7NG009889 [Panicum virgatum]|uniref:Uncharacterized protein n=1 Tax=Panicum virgatum TaxID=38727 RepID=A0A8T0PV63_PANVG|nr:hypothetical protein PVAP13_7NG009889 [Panicum virgatum]
MARVARGVHPPLLSPTLSSITPFSLISQGGRLPSPTAGQGACAGQRAWPPAVGGASRGRGAAAALAARCGAVELDAELQRRGAVKGRHVAVELSVARRWGDVWWGLNFAPNPCS